MPAEWQEFSLKSIVEVKQRVQTIVVYREINEDNDKEEVKEAVVNSYDRPVQAEYT